MKKFGKKILALFMALMCLATVGVVTANAASEPNFKRTMLSVAKQSQYGTPNSYTRVGNKSVADYELKDNSKAKDRSARVVHNYVTGNSTITLYSTNKHGAGSTIDIRNYNSKGEFVGRGH